MKIHKKLFSVLVVACLFLSVVGITGGGPAKAASGKTKVTLKEGKSATLKLKNSKKKIKRVTWKSKNKKIATVSKKGKVKAKTVGNTKITARVTLRNGKKYTSVYKISVQRKKNLPSPAKTALPQKPTPTATVLPQKPTANPLPMKKPKIEAVGVEQGETIGWEAFQAKMVSYTSAYSKPDIANQFITSRNELMTLIKKLKAGTESTEQELLIKELDAYDNEYFQNHVLCLVNVQLTCGYRPSITQLYQKDNGGKLPDIMMQYEQIKEYGDGQSVPSIMINYIYRLEIEKTALKVAPPSESRPVVNPTASPQPVPEIGAVSTTQGLVADWKPLKTESVSHTEWMGSTGVKNQLITSHDELKALIELLKADPYSADEPVITELEKYDGEYFQNHVLCLLDVELTCGYSPSIKRIYSGDGGGNYADIMMQYEQIKEYGDDQCVPDVMMNYVYRIEIEKSEVMLDYAEAE